MRNIIPAKAGIQSFQYLLDAGSSPAWRNNGLYKQTLNRLATHSLPHHFFLLKPNDLIISFMNISTAEYVMVRVISFTII